MTSNSFKPGARLERQIGFWSAVAVVVGSTIGSGIFRSPAGIAEKLPGPLPMMSAWIVAGLFVLCGALTLAEVGGAFPYAGGLYVYLREAYGRLFGFLFGWAQLVLIRPASQGAVALVFAEYALRLIGRTPESPDFNLYATYLAIAAMIVVATANYRGVRLGTGVQNLTTIAKTGGLLVLIVLAVSISLPSAGGHFSPPVPQGSFSLAPFGLALVSVLWAYDGWADVSYVGGEVTEPRKNVPRAILTGTTIIIAVYLLANLAYLAVFPVSQIIGSKQIAADVMQQLVGAPGVVFIVATVMLSTFGTLNGSLLTAPRIFYALAEDRMFFKPIAKVHPRFHTPHVSIVLTMFLSIVFVIVAKMQTNSDAFTTLTDAFVIALVPFYGLSVASVFVFRAREGRRSKVGGTQRRRDKGTESAIRNPQSEIQDADLPPSVPEPPALADIPDRPPYDPSIRTPLYPVVPALFVASTIFLLGNSLIDESSRQPTLITLSVLAAGVPIYFLTVGRTVGRRNL